MKNLKNGMLFRRKMAGLVGNARRLTTQRANFPSWFHHSSISPSWMMVCIAKNTKNRGFT